MRICVELCGGIIAAAVLIVAVAVWRLSEGPVQTGFLTPYLERAFSEAGGNSIEIGETFLVWDDRSRDLVLHAADIAVRDPEGRRIASLPEVAFELSSSAMLQGTVAPRQIEIIAPRIRLLRSAEGEISFGGDAGSLELPEGTQGGVEDLVTDAGPGAGGNDESLVLGGIVQELLADRSAENPLSFLNEVRIRDGQIFVRDDLLGLSWAAPAADISLRRDIVGLAGDIRLGFVGNRDPATLDAAFLFDKRDQVVDFAAGFSDISLEALAAVLPILAPVGGVTSRISGSVATSVSLDGSIGQTGFEIRGLAGTLKIPGVEMEPLPVRDLTMRGRYDDADQRFDLDEARVSLGSEDVAGPVLSLSGVFDYEPQTGGDWIIDAEARLEDVPLADLARYWPESVADGARPWVTENVTAGTVAAATAKVEIQVPDGDFAATDLVSLNGDLQYRDLTVHYLRPLPPIENIDGTATFDSESLRFAVASGSLLSLAVGQSTVEITELGKADPQRGLYERLTIDTRAAGAVADALAIVDHPRLALLSKLDMSAEGSGGTFSADLGFQFPLAKALSFEDIALQVDANVQDGALRNVLLGQDMTGGRLALQLDTNGMEIAGPLKLGGVPVSMRWKESFLDDPKVRTVLEAEIPRIVDEERARFGLDIGDIVVGPLSANVSMISAIEGLWTLEVAADLSETTMELEEISWNKDAGVEASLRLEVALDNQGPVAFNNVVLQAGDLVARGQARPGPDREGIGWMRFERLAFGRSDLQNVVVEQSDGTVAVAVESGVLDVQPFVEDDEKDAPQQLAEARQDPADRNAGAENPREFVPLSVRAPNLERLYFFDDRRLEQVNLELVRSREGWETIRLSGSIPEQYWSPRETSDEPSDQEPGADGAQPPVTLDRRYLQFSLAPDASSNGLRLLARSDDLGALLRATNITDTIVGGTIRILGSSAGPTPTHPINAKVVARDFVMVEAPALAKLLTVASFTGVLDLLRGDGIGFSGMDGEFVLDDGVATTELMRIYGPALGLTSRGKIDFDDDVIDLTGTVVPAYSVNSFIGNIPLLGPLLTGGEGEGLIAVVYGVRGRVEDPEVSVNPLSALTPGFLRNIFNTGPQSDDFEAVPERIDR
ncbi:AsmA-like C-terminal region-containing protein [Pelagibius sp.]|uniref:YhdP family protein n=1 Tax=Pelagibius sp. TaxID=1931238 RepID=UPI003B50A829